jgi:hypothetical protein
LDGMRRSHGERRRLWRKRMITIVDRLGAARAAMPPKLRDTARDVHEGGNAYRRRRPRCNESYSTPPGPGGGSRTTRPSSGEAPGTGGLPRAIRMSLMNRSYTIAAIMPPIIGPIIGIQK